MSTDLAINQVHNLISEYKIKPTKKRGQNFLIDEDVYENIIAAANLSKNDNILEIGPGLGTLTERVAPLVKKITSVEVDKNLAAILQYRFKKEKNIKIVEADILDSAVKKIGISAPYKIVANIPYNITSPILKKFLTQDIQPESMTLLVQKEVAERIVAPVGQMSILAISVQLYSQPKIMATVVKDAFFPAPEVDSCILQLNSITKFPYKDVDEKLFWRIVKVGFSARRKKLKNNLASGFKLNNEQVESILTNSGIESTARAQELSLNNWHNLSKVYTKYIK